jgi:transcription elongation factor GreA
MSSSTPLGAARTLITREGERSLRDELERLRLELAVEYPERLRRAREFGESDANDDYLQIKEEEAVLRSRIARLDGLLNAAIISDGKPSKGLIGIGTIVDVEDVRNGRRASHRLIGSFELSGPGDVSASSPVGQALFGRAVGDSVEVDLPNGRRRKLRVVDVNAAVGNAARPSR